MATAPVLSPSHIPICTPALPREQSKAGSWKLGHSPAPQPWPRLPGLFADAGICQPLGEELAQRL